MFPIRSQLLVRSRGRSRTPRLAPGVPDSFPGVPFVLVTLPAPGCYMAASAANPRYLGRLLVTSWMSSLPTSFLGAGPSLLLLLLFSLGYLSSCSCSSSPWLQYFEGGHYKWRWRILSRNSGKRPTTSKFGCRSRSEGCWHVWEGSRRRSVDRKGDPRGLESTSVELGSDQFIKGALTLWELVRRDRFQ